MSRTIISKVPAITLGFWIIKILATTLGETGGDTVSMTMTLGYLTGSAIFVTVLVALAWAQIGAKRYHPLLYWATIVASTTAGTTMADFATRSIGIVTPAGRRCSWHWCWHRLQSGIGHWDDFRRNDP